jgi:hypothetical protein
MREREREKERGREGRETHRERKRLPSIQSSSIQASELCQGAQLQNFFYDSKSLSLER